MDCFPFIFLSFLNCSQRAHVVFVIFLSRVYPQNPEPETRGSHEVFFGEMVPENRSGGREKSEMRKELPQGHQSLSACGPPGETYRIHCTIIF